MSSKPNIIFIITDQQRYETINALGYPYMETPHLDRLAREGTVFTNCHVGGASCAPARGALFTGNFPHTTGIMKNADTWRDSWIRWLNEGGYTTINVGKMHSWPMTTPLGFQERYVVENKDRYLEARYFFDEWDRALAANGLVKQQREQYRALPDYNERLGAFEWNLPAHLHSDMFVGGFAKWWVDHKPNKSPLFLQVGFPGPHPPYDPAPAYAERYLDKDLPLPQVSQADLDSQPPPFLAMRKHNTEVDHDSVVHQFNATADQQKRQRAHYFANVTMIDEKVGELMQALEAKGYLENAIVVFTSDHGDCLGDHGQSQKWTCYEPITRVPFIVWGPGNVKAGHTVDAQIQQQDIAESLLELAGVEPQGPMETRSVTAALRGEAFEAQPFTFTEQCRDGILQETEFMTMVRAPEWKLVHFLGESFGQLFNLKEDPDELVNLWNDQGAAARKAELLDALREWHIASACRTREWGAAFR